MCSKNYSVEGREEEMTGGWKREGEGRVEKENLEPEKPIQHSLTDENHL
jgi:hypothetical protein